MFIALMFRMAQRLQRSRKGEGGALMMATRCDQALAHTRGGR
jgi:hypothetical protein